MSQRYAITQTKSQLFLNFTHLRTTNAIGYQRFDLEKSGTNLRVGQKRLGKLGGDVFATRRFAIACDSRPYSCCKICAIPVNSCQNRGGRPTTSRQKRRPRRTLRRGRRWNGCWLRRRSAVVTKPTAGRQATCACRAGRRRLGRRAYRRLLRRGRPCRRMRWLTRRSRWWSRPPPCRSRCSRRRSRRSRCLR